SHWPVHRSDDLDLDSRLRLAFQQLDHPRIGEFAVVNQQLPLCAQNEFGKLSPGIDRADDEMLGLHPLGLPINVRFEQSHRLGDKTRLVGDHSETAAVMDVQECEVERQQVERAPVNDHHLAVIADQVFGRTRDFDVTFDQTFLQLLDFFQALFVGISNQRVDADAASGGCDQLLLDLQPIQAVENDFDAFCRFLNSFEKRLNAVAWLNDNLHRKSSGFRSERAGSEQGALRFAPGRSTRVKVCRPSSIRYFFGDFRAESRDLEALALNG